MIRRDEHGIICQHDPADPSYMDGGDSSHRTGIMAMCGSARDKFLLANFILFGKGRRHPSQKDYSDPRSWTRDQLIPTMAGLKETGRTYDARKLFMSHLKRGFICQNELNIHLEPKAWYDRDILSPSHIGHLILCAKVYPLYPFLIFSWLWMTLDLLWTTKVTPTKESNQPIVMFITAGKFWVKAFNWLQPNWRDTVRSYWGGWRDQSEIGEALIKKVEENL
jgi:hypothetical protein